MQTTLARTALFLLALSLTAPTRAQSAVGAGDRRALERVPAGPAQEPLRNPSTGIDENDDPAGVLLHSGEFVLRRTDLSVRGRAMGFAFTRTYRSGRHVDGPLGFGWDANVFARLQELPGGSVAAFDGAGRRDVYANLGGGSYAAPRGYYTKLVKHGGGFDLRDRDGTKHFFDLQGRLLRVEDRIGNAHDYLYGGGGTLDEIEDEFGRSILFAYDGNGRLETVTDFDGREVRFAYDGRGDLVEARSPLVTGTPHGNDFPLGKRERYVYDGGTNPSLSHGLTQVIRPNEVEDGSLVPCLVNRYGQQGRKLGRIVEQTVGGTNASGVAAGGTLTFVYRFNGSGGPAGTASRTRVVDRNGNASVYYHDAHGHALRVVEDAFGPTPFVTDLEYNADGELTRHVRPLGNETLLTYDAGNPDRFQQGNLLEVLRLPDARGGDQPEIRTSFTYEPLFNRVLTETRPRGHDAGYTPPNGGANSPARYTRTSTYDYQEAAAAPAEATAWGITIPPALLNLGDVNDDGRTDQAMGNLIREEGPTVELLAGSEQAAAEGDTSQEIVTDRVYDDFGQLVEHEDPRGNVDIYVYYPENDPDGDGLDPIAGRDPVSGGYRATWIEDALVGPRREDAAPLTAITTGYEYDRRGNLVVRNDGRGNDHTTTYNDLDQVVEEEDPKVDAGMANGYLRRFTYDANDNVVGESVQNWTADASGAQVLDGSHPFFDHTSVYDILDNEVERTQDATRDPAIPASAEPEALTTRWRYDANENVVRVETPVSVAGSQPDNVVTSTYDARDLLVSQTRGDGSPEQSTWTYEHDENGNRVLWTDAVDNDAVAGPETETYEFDGYDRLVSTTDRAGNERTVTYDAGSRVVEEEARGPVDGSGGPDVSLERIEYQFDELGRLYQIDQDLFLPAGVTTTHPIVLVDGSLTAADGKVSERIEYDANDRITFQVEDDGDVYGHEYDGADRRVRSTQPLFDGPTQNATVREYDGNDNVVRTEQTHVSPEGHAPPGVLETYDVFDELDRKVRTTDELGSTCYADYDSRDNVVGRYDARGALIVDPLGLYGGMINDRGNPVRHFYDGIGRRWLTVYELHVEGQGNLAIDTSNPAIPTGLVEHLAEFDANDRLVRRLDGNGNAVVTTFDALDRVVSQTNADGGTCTRTYDDDHNVIAIVDENGTSHALTYDGLDRLVEHDVTPNTAIEIRPGLPMLGGTTQRDFEYDGLSRQTRSEDGNEPADGTDDWVVETRYDSLSRVVEEVQNGRAVASSFEADVRTQLFYPGAGRVVDFSHDGADQVVQVADPGVLDVVTNFMGDCAPPIFRQSTWFNPGPQTALTVAQALDGVEKLSQSTVTSPSAGVIGQQMVQRTRDHAVEAQDVLLQNGANFVDAQFDWSLTSLNQILVHDRILDVNGVPVGTHHEVQYGPAQEVLQVTDGINPIVTNTFDPTYERTNAPFVYDGGQPSGSGLRTEDQDFLFQWDGLNRLIAVYQAAPPHLIVAEYDYDASPAVAGGRRVEKDVTNSGALDGLTRFYFDEIHCIEETTDPGGGEQLKSQFFFGERHPDDVLAMDLDTNADGVLDALFFYSQDVNNNVTHLVDPTGAPVELYAYDHLSQPQVFDAAGNPLATSAVENPFLFTGRRWEPETGLMFYRARYYDPEEGEFLSRDPIGFWGDPANHGNPMAYGGNDPWNRVDPSGLDSTQKNPLAKDLDLLAKDKASRAKGIHGLLKAGTKALAGLRKAEKNKKYATVRTLIGLIIRDIEHRNEIAKKGEIRTVSELIRLSEERLGSDMKLIHPIKSPQGSLTGRKELRIGKNDVGDGRGSVTVTDAGVEIRLHRGKKGAFLIDLTVPGGTSYTRYENCAGPDKEFLIVVHDADGNHLRTIDLGSLKKE